MKINTTFSYLLFAFLGMLIFSACSSNNNGEINLVLNLEKGMNYHYTMSSRQKVSAMKTDIKQADTIDINYQKAPDSNLIKATISRIKVTIKSPVVNASFDTKRGATQHSNQPGIAHLLQLAHKSYTLHVNNDGTINNVKLDNQNNTIAPDSTLSKVLKQSFDFYPGYAIKPGDTWDTKTSGMFQNIDLTQKTTYTLTAVHQDTAIISANSLLSSPKRNVVTNHIKMSLEMNGTQKGKLTVFIPEGRILKADFSYKINSHAQAHGQKFDRIIKGSSSIRSEKEKL